MGFAFDGFMLDLKRRELRRGTELVRLEPQAFDLLTYLVRHRDRVIGRDELVDAIWGGRIVTDATLTTRINIVRRAIADDGKTQRLIRTLSRRGIRFVAQVIEVAEDKLSLSLPALQGSGPSVAVLPLSTSEGDLASAAIAGGIVEDIATVLTRFPWLAVIAGSPAFPHVSEVVDLRSVGQRLGVRYLLAGSVRRNEQRLRVTVQLIDVESRAYLWAERIDGELSDRFELQDRTAAIVAANIELKLEAAGSRRSAGQPISDVSWQDLCLRALRACYAYATAPLLEARELLDHAIDRDPDNGPVLAIAAGCRQFLDCAGWGDDREMNRQSAVDLAQKALQADSRNPTVLAEAARVLAYFTGDIDTAILMIQRALAVDPSHVRSWYWSGWIRLLAGEPDLAAEHFETSSRLNPTERPHLTGLGIAHFFSGGYQQAVTMLNASLYDRPRWPTTYRFLAAAYAHLGELEAARSAVGRLQAVAPAPAAPINRFHKSPFQNRDHSARYLEGLSLAMGDR
jgi:TolB-like protein/cytochrome c-type biogenesis protein CcmH/NrfG